MFSNCWMWLVVEVIIRAEKPTNFCFRQVTIPTFTINTDPWWTHFELHALLSYSSASHPLLFDIFIFNPKMSLKCLFGFLNKKTHLQNLIKYHPLLWASEQVIFNVRSVIPPGYNLFLLVEIINIKIVFPVGTKHGLKCLDINSWSVVIVTQCPLPIILDLQEQFNHF